MDNIVTLVGNLVADPDIRVSENGKSTLLGRIAVNERYQMNGEWNTRTNYFNFVAWDGLAMNTAMSVGKGDRVVLVGRFQTRDYVDANGVIQYRHEMVAKEIGVSTRYTVVNPVSPIDSDVDDLTAVAV